MQQLDEAPRKKKQGCDSKQMEKKVKGRRENYLQLVIRAVERQGRRVRQNWTGDGGVSSLLKSLTAVLEANI